MRIGGRALDILTLLVERAGELVSSADLEAHVWPDTYVHPSNLKVHIVALRRILREASADSHAIINVPGRGYRFTGPVSRRGHARLSGRPRKSVRRALQALPRLFGREEEICRLVDALSAHPLVTVVGAGGVGKTSLALAAAARLRRRFRALPCFVDFSSLDDPQHVVQSIAVELRLRADSGDPIGSIADSLRTTPRLLILDNCEHLAAAIAAVAERLAADLRGSAILATSREPLRTRTGRVLRLPPLSCPEDAPRISVAQALRHPAVELFLARADERGTFSLRDDEEAASVSGICRRLDGLPLAIELAAKRLGTMRPADLLRLLQQGLDDALGPHDAFLPARQRTLAATLDWSYRLLSSDESLVLRFVSVFSGGFATADAVALLAPLGISEADILVSLQSVAAKSFATVELRQGEPCYRLYESVRRYGIARLEAGGEHERARMLHACHLLRIIERAEEEWRWQVVDEWVTRHESRLDDLRQALSWAFGKGGDPSIGVRLAAAAIPLWEELCSVDEARLRVAHALEVARSLPECEPRLKARLALRHAWTLTWSQARLPETTAPWTECLDIAREAGDGEYELRAMWGLATYETFTGRTVAAIDHLRAFDALAERTGDPSVRPDGQRLLALALAYVGEVREAHEALERLARQVGRFEKQTRVTRFSIDRYCIVRSSLAFAQWLRGRTRSALAAATQAVEAAVALDHPVSLANSLFFAGVPLALWTGHLDRAEAGLALLRGNRAIQNTAVWPRLARFFEASLRQAKGEQAAMSDMRAALDELLETGFVTRGPMYLAMLAEAMLEQGCYDEAEVRLEDAARRLDLYRERWCNPELLRLRGRLATARRQGRKAERLFEAAIEEAASLGTLTFELRAACDLARALAERGCRDAALAALAATCAKFKETGPGTEVGSARLLMTSLG